MQRVKAAVVAVVAVAGLFALTACGAQPDRAATMGNLTIEHTDVDDVVSQVEADLKASNRSLLAYGDVRQQVVEYKVFNELARRYAQEKGLGTPTPDYNALAAEFGLPVSDPFVRLRAEYLAYLNLLVPTAPEGQPTEAEMRDIYDRFVAVTGATEDQVSYDNEVKPSLLASTEYKKALGLRDELVKAAQRYGLVINPRYTPAVVPLDWIADDAYPNGELVLVGLPLDLGTDAVRDVG